MWMDDKLFCNILDGRRRRYANIEPTLGHPLAFTGIPPPPPESGVWEGRQSSYLDIKKIVRYKTMYYSSNEKGVSL